MIGGMASALAVGRAIASARSARHPDGHPLPDPAPFVACDLLVTEHLAKTILSLPISPELTAEEVDGVVEAMRAL